MHRRRILASLAGLSVGLAGCLDAPTSADEAVPTTDGPSTGGSGTVGGLDLPVPERDLARGAPKDAIPAITDPAFGSDWSDVARRAREEHDRTYPSDPSLDPDARVIGVERDGDARAYPLAVLNWHEVVNDEFDDPILVTYCPLCGSGVTAERWVDGAETVFGVSGLLWNSDLVMYDRATGSLWSQIAATAIRGPRTGDRLTLVPSTMTTWREWRRTHPGTRVLLPPPLSDTVRGAVVRDYTRDPYAGYAINSRIGIGENELEDDRLHPKTQVLGVAFDGAARAYPLEAVAEAGVVNDRVGDHPVVVAVGPDDTLVAYLRRLDGRTLEFSPGGDAARMRAGGSTWEVTTGRAVDGPLEGRRLSRAGEGSPMFWFAWVDFHPDTGVYSG